MPAATSAPKASTRITSVTGTDVISARWKSVARRSLMALVALASPTWPISRSGCARCTAAVAASAGVDAVLRGVGIARDLERHQRGAAVGRELAGVVRVQWRLDRRDRRTRDRRATRSSDRRSQLGALQAAAAALDEHLLGGAPGRELAGQHPLGARASRRSRTPPSFIVTTPAAEPSANATSTNANQPSTALRRCAALQRAARAVRLSVGGGGPRVASTSRSGVALGMRHLFGSRRTVRAADLS